MIMLPSSVADCVDPEMREMIEKIRCRRPVASEGWVEFFKLSWDAVGFEFASRHTQYGMFYAGAAFVASDRWDDWAFHRLAGRPSRFPRNSEALG